jgi:hypothetical protein
MLLAETLAAMEPEQKIKVGSTRGTRYFYIGAAGDFCRLLERFGHTALRKKVVVEVREADQAVDPEVLIVMVDGTENGSYWATDEYPGSDLNFGWWS